MKVDALQALYAFMPEVMYIMPDTVFVFGSVVDLQADKPEGKVGLP